MEFDPRHTNLFDEIIVRSRVVPSRVESRPGTLTAGWARSWGVGRDRGPLAGGEALGMLIKDKTLATCVGG